MPGRVWMALGIMLGVFLMWKMWGGESADDKVVRICKSKPRSATASGPGSALLATQEFIDCVRKEGKPSGDFLKRAELIEVPPPVDCRFVGVWKSTRPRTVYQVTMDADRRFEAHRLEGEDSGVFEGAWLADGNRISWLYDRKLVWPPDINEVRDASTDAFSLVEVDGSISRFELIERTRCR